MEQIRTYIEMDEASELTISRKLVLTTVHLHILKELAQNKYLRIKAEKEYSKGYKEALGQLWEMGVIGTIDGCWDTTYTLNEEISRYINY